MDPVSSEPFFASKTMVILCLGMGLVFAMIVLAVVVKVVWGVDTFQLVGSGILGISSHSGAGTVRNMAVDGSARQIYTQASVAPPVTPPAGPYGSGPPGGQQ